MSQSTEGKVRLMLRSILSRTMGFANEFTERQKYPYSTITNEIPPLFNNNKCRVRGIKIYQTIILSNLIWRNDCLVEIIPILEVGEISKDIYLSINRALAMKSMCIYFAI